VAAATLALPVLFPALRVASFGSVVVAAASSVVVVVVVVAAAIVLDRVDVGVVHDFWFHKETTSRMILLLLLHGRAGYYPE